MEKISVIIPSYKPNFYIWECLESVNNQSLDKKLYEVIIVLNGDKEPYYTKILNYLREKKMNNFKLVYTNVKGVSNARNIGLEKSNGNFIIFLDDDDLINKEYLLLSLTKITEEENYNNTIVAVESTNFIGDYEIKLPLNKLVCKEYSIFQKRSIFSVVWGIIIPRKIIGNIRFNIDYKNSEDSLFMMMISKNIYKIKSIEGDYLHYRRIRNNSASFRKMSIRYIFANNFKMFIEYIKLLFQKGYNKRFILLRMLAIIKGTYVQILRNR